MSYATLAEFKAWATIDDTIDDAALQTILDAATRWIDRKTGRHFVLETGVTKYFYPGPDGRISVPDLISITSIAADTSGDRSYATTLATTDYELLPYTDPSGVPSTRYQEIRIWPTSSRQLSSARLVRIVGNFGYVDTGNVVPADVKQACLLMASREWKRRETPLGIFNPGGISAVQSTADPDVELLVQPYTRVNSWVVV